MRGEWESVPRCWGSHKVHSTSQCHVRILYFAAPADIEEDLAQRKQFGKAIAEFQGMQFQYATIALGTNPTCLSVSERVAPYLAFAEIEAAKLLVYNAARLKEEGQPFVTEASMAKLYASQVAERTASQCINMCGGVGFTRELGVEKFFRYAPV